MKIENLAHILRAAKAITGETVFVLAGSQAVLAQYPSPPSAMAMSMEIDIYPRFRPDLSEVIEGALGANSPFHGAFGYHADGIGPETAIFPAHWEGRAIELSGHPLLDGATAICPEIHDLAASKLVAFREKDKLWVRVAIQAGLVDPATLRDRVDEVDYGNAKHDTLNWIDQEMARGNDPTP